MLTPYGKDNIIIMLLSSVVIFVLGYFLSNIWLKYLLYILSIILFLFTLWFFRDPHRNIPQKALDNDKIIIAPADGKVVEIIEEVEKHYLKENSIRISIFLSPIDVHVNRSPANGVVDFYEYYPGEYLVAFHPKSSELNEHSRIGIKNSAGKIFFKQIVGVLARRIVCEAKVGDTLTAGQKFGMMKFGSRMDVALPLGTKILIEKGQSVVGGETIIAELP